jgi:hypothetical protein
VPLLQICPALHAVPHVPQFFVLLVRSTQDPEHAVSIVGDVEHVAAQAPSEQT